MAIGSPGERLGNTPIDIAHQTGPEEWAGPAEGLEAAPEAEEMLPAGDETIPPERVRFTAPAVLEPEDGRDTVDGAVLNLSIRGVAVTTAWEGRPGQRVWVQFRLGLAEDPIEMLCEVIWCSRRDAESCLLGLRFASVTRSEEERLRGVVSERSEGRAGEWPLPVMPTGTAAAPKGANPYLTAAAGMAAGIGLALALSVIPNAGVSGPQPPSELGPVATATAASDAGRAPISPTSATPPRSADARAPAGGDLGKPATAPPIAATATTAAQPAPEARSSTRAEGEKVAAAEPPAVPAKPAAEPAKVQANLPRKTEPARAQSVEGDVLRPLGSASGVELALLCDGPVADHVTFWLDSPRRLVVDVYGRKSGFNRRGFRIEHQLAKSLRVGEHRDKVRFVIETAPTVSARVRARPSGKALIVELDRG
jgi:hypothetical protein